MRKFLAAAVLGTFLLTGCTQIVYDSPPITETSTTTTTKAVDDPQPAETKEPSKAIPDKYSEAEININPETYSATIELEEVEGQSTQRYLMGYSGAGFIALAPYETVTMNVYAPSTQYYSLSVVMCAFDTGIDVIVGEGTDYSGGDTVYHGVSKGVIYIEDVNAFTPFMINGIYLKKGDNTVTLQCVSGTAYMDRVEIANGRTVTEGFYSMNTTPLNPNADTRTVKIMQYFGQIYGEKTLTGQQVTSGTNAEIAAIYSETGRLPAIRAGDLTFAQSRSPYYDEEMTDLALAQEWAELGGLVSYGWTWYSPTDSSHYLSSAAGFDFSRAYTNIDISVASSETLERIYGEGEITRETFRLMQDMDEIAEALKRLMDSGVTVLFRPLADAGSGGYWWSDSSEAYLWLWRTMVKRFNEYHGLTNIIWVWSGEGAAFYPGDEYVDIIGEDFYNFSGDSGNTRFMGTAYYNAGAVATAMTDCLLLPDPDVLAQDNAKWLWFSLGKGDVLIDENGELTQKYTSNRLLERAYNHESFITLDELPNFN